jgi:hypothetical protein
MPEGVAWVDLAVAGGNGSARPNATVLAIAERAADLIIGR